MFEKTRNQVPLHRGLLLGVWAALASFIALPPGIAVGQMAIDEVIITSGPAWRDGTFTDYYIDLVVSGFEIAGVTIDTASGESVDLVESVEDEFICDDVPGEPCEGFLSLDPINALGNITFTFFGEGGELDSVVIPGGDYAPGAGQAGMPMIVSPPVGDSSLPPGNLLEWASAPAWVDAIQVDLVDLALDDGVDEALFFDTTVTSWTPTGVVPGRLYDFELTFADIYDFEDPRMTLGMRPFLFTSAFTAFNVKLVPEPSSALSWPIAGLALLGLGRRSTRRR